MATIADWDQEPTVSIADWGQESTVSIADWGQEPWWSPLLTEGKNPDVTIADWGQEPWWSQLLTEAKNPDGHHCWLRLEKPLSPGSGVRLEKKPVSAQYC